MPIISPKIPTGLEELMRGLAKSCIKENPANIYEFAAEYFENLLKERDGSVDQSYKKFATYKVYKKHNKSARNKREKENRSNDVNDARVDNGFGKDGSAAVNYVNPDVFGGRDSSLEEIILPESSRHMTASPPKAQNSISSESEINAAIHKEPSLEIEGPREAPSGNSEDDDIKNMVFDEDMEQAALKIQSTFRGHKVRRDMEETKAESAELAEDVNEEQQKEPSEPEIDEKQIEDNLESVGEGEVDESLVPEESSGENQADEGEINMQDAPTADDDDDVANMVLDDEMEEAALKIQATFRGHRTRREIKQSDVDPFESEPVESANEDEGTQNNENVDTEIIEGDGINSDDLEVTVNANVEAAENAGCVEEPQIESEIDVNGISGEEANGAIVEEENVCEALSEMETAAENNDEQLAEAVPVEDGGEEEIAGEISGNDDGAGEGMIEACDDFVEGNEEIAEIEGGEVAEKEMGGEGVAGEESVAEIENVKETESEVEAENEVNAETEVETENPADVEPSAPLEADEPAPAEDLAPSEAEASVEKIPSEEQTGVDPEPTEEKLETTPSTEAATDEPATEKLSEEVSDAEEALKLFAEGEKLAAEAEKLSVEEIKESSGEIAVDAAEIEISAEMGEATASDSVAKETTEAVDESLIDSPPAVASDTEKEEKAPTDIDENPHESDAMEKVGSIEQEITVGIDDDDEAFKRKPTIENELSLFEKVSVEEESVPEGDGGETIDGENLTTMDDKIDPEAEPVIELTDNGRNGIVDGENVNEGEDEKPQGSEALAEGEDVAGNEGEPQEGLSDSAANENVNENSEDFAAGEYDVDAVPVVEPTCEKKSIENLEADQENTESEIPKESSLSEIVADQADQTESPTDVKDNLEKLPSSDIEYAKLKESLSEHESVDEVDNKSRDITDEKSIDGDTPASEDNKSIDEGNEQLAVDGGIEPLLCSAISPIELMDEVVNEYAKAVASEIFPTSDLIKSADDENPEFLMEENPLGELEPPKAIDLSAEGVCISQDESEPIRDEILKPEEEFSEIPEEENQAPVDVNIPTVSLEEKSPSIGDEEQDKEEEGEAKSDPDQPKATDDDDDIANMVLDEEMEDAAIKIQAVFRGHKVRKHQQSSEEENKQDEDDGAACSHVVVEQCTDDNMETQDQEEIEQQDTSADVEEIQESETGDQEATQEESHEEENAEDETAVEETEENDTTEQGEDDPEGAEGESSEQQQQQNNDDDDVANMVLDDEMEQAALKIQSTFRGHKTRKDMKKDDAGEAATTSDEPEAPKDPVEEVDDDIANMVLDEEMAQAALKIQSTFRGHKTRKEMKKEKDDEGDEDEKKEEDEGEEEKKEEEPPKEEEAAAAPPEKTEQQLKDEEDIAGLVMDAEMEATALKIQSAFRGKKFGRKSKDGDETSSSAADQTAGEETQDDEEAPDAFHNELSEERMECGEASSGEKIESDYASAHYSSQGDGQYSIERGYEQETGAFGMQATIDDVNLMQGGGIFPDPSGESSDILTGSSGDDRDPDRHSSYEKVPSDKSYEIDDPIMERKKSVDPSNDDEKEKSTESFDSAANKDMAARCEAEAMYYSLKKNEALSVEKQLSEVEEQAFSTGASIEKQQHDNEEGNEEQEIDGEEEEEEDDDDVVFGMQPSPSSAKRLKYGMSMDDRLLGSILSQDYSMKTRGYPDDGFDPMLEAAMRNHQFMEKLHGISRDDENGNSPYADFPDGVGDEDQFDDLYNSNTIRQKIMASSISIADSDYFDPTFNKSIIDDDKIRTALETIHSTDSESTIGSAATKIQAGERILTRRNNHSMQPYSSIGNAAIDKSLDEFIQSQELRIDKFDEEMEGYNSPPPRKQESVEEWTDDTTTYTDSDRKVPIGGIIEIKLEQKQSFLTVDERRRTLHREDAIQRNSTREDEDSSKSSNASAEKSPENKSSSPDESSAMVGSFAQQDSVVDTEINVPVIDLTPKTKTSSQAQVKPQRMKRQHTMPVQIQTDVIRVIPKHLRKRIKSADGDKKKRFSN